MTGCTMIISNQSKIQEQAYNAWNLCGRRGIVAAATGMGKSKVAINAIQDLCKQNPGAKILIMVPTELLRDQNWPEEFVKWKCKKYLKKNVQIECYASIAKIKGQKFDLVVADEAHKFSENNSKFFEQNEVEEILGLTATPPREPEKRDLLRRVVGPICFSYHVDQGVDDGVVTDYRINVIYTELDTKEKYLEAGTKGNKFLQTEFAMYSYLSKQVAQGYYKDPKALKFKLLARMRLIYNLKSKTRVAKLVLSKLSPKERVLVFCGSIAQAEEILPGQTYHSEVSAEQFNAFKNQETTRLAVVNAVNEGHTIPALDKGIIAQIDSNPRSLVQRLGRFLRFRPNHKAVIYVLICKGTVDENWFEKASELFDPSKIKYYYAKNLFPELNA